MQIRSTPWGAPQTIDDIGRGVCFVTTASHGGYFVPPAANAQIPAHWRAISFNGQACKGWYEEDCDWSMVALALPDLFSPEEISIARATFKHCHEPKLYRGAGEISGRFSGARR